eukprot:g13004.t1 g13004   contig7:653564-654118(+)
MDLQHHEQHICEFKAGLGKLVEKFRQSEERSNHILQHHQMQLAASSRMMAMQSRQLMMIRARNAGNVFDSLELAYQACCFPGRLYASKGVVGEHVDGGRAEEFGLQCVVVGADVGIGVSCCISRCSTSPAASAHSNRKRTTRRRHLLLRHT